MKTLGMLIVLIGFIGQAQADAKPKTLWTCKMDGGSVKIQKHEDPAKPMQLRYKFNKQKHAVAAKDQSTTDKIKFVSESGTDFLEIDLKNQVTVRKHRQDRTRYTGKTQFTVGANKTEADVLCHEAKGKTE